MVGGGKVELEHGDSALTWREPEVDLVHRLLNDHLPHYTTELFVLPRVAINKVVQTGIYGGTFITLRTMATVAWIAI